MGALKCAYVTLLTKNSYFPGTLVLDYGLQAVGSRYPLVVMVTPGLPMETKKIMRRRGMIVHEVESLRPTCNLDPHDVRFEDTWTKLRVFELDEYDRIVFLDCDIAIRRNIDDLFDMELPKDEIAAAHVCACNPRKLLHYPADWIPENCAHTRVAHPNDSPPRPKKSSPRPHSQLNSGTLVLTPSKQTAKEIYHYLETSDRVPTFRLGDQELLSAFFEGKWRPIKWYYNALKTLRHTHTNEWDDNEVRCAHYIFPDKPWKRRVDPPEVKQLYGILHAWWWEQFDELGDEMRMADPEGWNLALSTVEVSH